MPPAIDRRTCLAGLTALALTTGHARAQTDRTQAGRSDTLLVMEKGDHALSFYELASGRRTGRVELPGEYPHEFAVDRAGARAYVGLYGAKSSTTPGPGGDAVYVVDLGTRSLARTIACAPFRRLHGLRLDAKDRLFVLSEDRDVLLGFDAPERAERPDRAVATGGLKGHLFSLSRDGETAYVANILSNTVSRVRPFAPADAPRLAATGLWPEGNALSPDEATLYVANRRSATLTALATEAMTVTRTLPTRGDVVRVDCGPEGDLILANYAEKSLSLLDPALKEMAVVMLGAAPVALARHPSSPLAFAALEDDRIAVVDLEGRRVQGYLATGREPDVMVLLPG
ncbi:YncE family protein [Methylobacterium sp. Gmos1]